MPELEDLLPGEPFKEPPIPRAIHYFLQSRRFEGEEAFAEFVASRYYEKCQPPYHAEVGRIKRYLRTVNLGTALSRLDRIIKGY